MLDNVAGLVAKELQRVKKYSSIHLVNAQFAHNLIMIIILNTVLNKE